MPQGVLPRRFFYWLLVATHATRAWQRQLFPREHRMAGANGADQKMTQQVTNKLSGRGMGSACQITVNAKNGEVTLSGTVQQAHQKKLATTVAAGVEGVRRVVDRLTVQPAVRR
jgi:osmotically-inducible protein OsmY